MRLAEDRKTALKRFPEFSPPAIATGFLACASLP
jgi:hypothetical protein